MFRLGLGTSLERDLALALQGLSGLKIRTVKIPHSHLLFTNKPGENITRSQAASWPVSRWCVVHVSQSVDSGWECITPPECRIEASNLVKKRRQLMGLCLGLVELGKPLSMQEAKQIPMYAAWVRSDPDGFFLPRLRFLKFGEPLQNLVVGQMGFVNPKCTRTIMKHLVKEEHKLSRQVMNVERPEHIPLAAKFNEYHGWGDHDVKLLSTIVGHLFHQDPTQIFRKGFLNPAEKSLIPALLEVRCQMTGHYCQRNIDMLQARCLEIPVYDVGEEDEEISMIRVHKGRLQKYVESRNSWYPSTQAELQHLKVDGLSAVSVAKAAKGAIHLGVGAESQQSDRRNCVQDCFHLLGYSGIKLPDDTVFRSLPQKLRNVNFSLLKPCLWPFKIEKSGDFSCAIAQLTKFVTTQWLVLQVHLTSGTSLHCVCIKERKIVDPVYKEWLPLCEESFAKLGIVRVVYAYMLCPHKKK